MDDAAAKETLHFLRQIQEHLYLSQADLGAQRETLGLVDVVHHPSNAIPDLNYVTPRRHTAWIAGSYIRQGLDSLLALERTPCVQVIEGLYPPLFARTLRELGLEAQQEIPLLLYGGGGVPAFSAKGASEDVRVERVHDQGGTELWWELWRNGLYDVLTPGIEPLIRWRDVDVRHGELLDVMVYRQKSLAGVARIGLQPENKSGQIVALALLQEIRSPELTRLLLSAALHQALVHACEIVFAPGEAEEVRKLCRELGFVDASSLISYVQRSELPGEGKNNGGLAQSVLAAS